MSERTLVYLRNRQLDKLVEATLIDDVTKEEVQATEDQWKPFLQEQLDRMRGEGIPKHKWPEHSHWDWQRKQERAQLLAYRMFGIECQSQMQGLMLVSTVGKVCRIPSQKGKPLVYVDYVAAAPWNVSGVVSEPRFSHVGSVLIATAITLSLEEEFSGRIGLHSLPQADEWYSRNCGMTDLGRDPVVQNLKYFEMTPQQALEFLK